jgi:starch synthase
MSAVDVLAVASEIYPLVSTGGLAEVAGALPGALGPHGIAVRTLVPGYPAVLRAIEGRSILHRMDDLFGGAATLVGGAAKGLDLFVLDAPHLYGRPGNPYVGPDGKDWPDNAQRFAALGSVAADIARGIVPGFVPHVLHAHDWQASLGPAYLRFGEPCATKSVVTIHNIAFQGWFPASLFASLNLPASAYAIDGVEYYGGVGYLKAGLQCADAITTVSPTYAREICAPGGGVGLDGLLRARQNALIGIVNGIDTNVWNPATDDQIVAPYDAKRLDRRARNKREIERRFGLAPVDGLLYGIVSRLTGHKGMDLVIDSIDALVESGARLALVGSGETALETAFLSVAERHPGRIGVVLGYREGLSHLLQAGADALLVPSRFEPCGLTQLHGLRYGCVPVVSRVGGLADTIIDANDAAVSAGVATGIQFSPVAQSSLVGALARAAGLYRDRKAWRSMQRRGMSADVSWQRGAGHYAALFRGLRGVAAASSGPDEGAEREDDRDPRMRVPRRTASRAVGAPDGAA